MAVAVYEVLPLLTRLSFRVTSAASHGDRLYAGCHDGAVRVYRSLPGV